MKAGEGRTADDVLASNEANTYVMSCYLTREDLYKGMREDLGIACAEIARLKAEMEEVRKALISINNMPNSNVEMDILAMRKIASDMLIRMKAKP